MIIPDKVVISPMQKNLLDPKLNHMDRPKSMDRGTMRNPHLGAIWDVNGHGIANDELPPMDLISPPQMSPTKKSSPANQVRLYRNDCLRKIGIVGESCV